MTDEIKNLIRLAQNGDEAAFESLIVENTGLIKSAVRRFFGRGVSDEDLFQLGAMGLVKAVKRFDLDYEVEFSTYAVPMILGEIRRFIRDDSIIKVPRSAKENAAMIRKIGREEGECELEKIAQRIGISYEDAVFALESTTPPESIEREIFEEGQRSVKLGDIIGGKESEEDKVKRMDLKNAIDSLPERDRKLIMLRYFKEMTQSQTAKVLQMGQVQVSRLEKKIIARIRERIS
ncbi:MAG: sigma-70 family RNA polymerase sigma factor [Clostridia bacterium]